MADLFTAETRDYLILAGVFLGILMLFTGLMQLVRTGENQSEARSLNVGPCSTTRTRAAHPDTCGAGRLAGAH